MKNLPGVIVIGDHVQALGIIRSLGRRGIPVYLLNDRSLCIGRFSRYLKRFIKAPTVSKKSEFVDFMIRLAKNEHVKDWILMPTNDAAVCTLSKHKGTLEEYYRVPTSCWDVIKYAYNKKLTYQLAEKNGVSIPKTIYSDSLDVLLDSLLDITFPVIIKGIHGYYFYQKAKTKAIMANSREELVKAYKKLFPIVKPVKIMTQEIIYDNPHEYVYSFCSFFKDGRAIAIWTGRKIREHPTGFGTGTFAESVYIPEIEELGTRILKAMNYYGISEIEFKRDQRDGKFKLLEMNARTWLWHSLAIRCGVDFPYLLYKDMLGEGVIPITSFKTNIKWIHIYTDVWMSIKEIIRGNLKMHDYLDSLQGEKEFAVFSVDDPLPFVCETLMLPYLGKTR